jgi:nucleoid DNA-binding protein
MLHAGAPMTKQELIKRVAANIEVAPSANRKTVELVIDAVFTELATYFVADRVGRTHTPRFTYPGFGTFTKKRRTARAGRNPRTGEPITIPAQLTLAFQPGTELKADLNREPRRRAAK